MRLSAPIGRQAMAFVLAGGRGSRLLELTDRRAKPAVHFGGKMRIIDFALSNALNSGIRRISVATQYKAHSLIGHLTRGWNFFRPGGNESFDIMPASQRVSKPMVCRTADAVFQNIDIIRDRAPKYMVILAGDHIYKMDYELMLQQHADSGADVTIGCLEVPLFEASGFGVMHVDANKRIIDSSRSQRSGADAGPARQGARLDGHLCVRDQSIVRPARTRCKRSEVEPRFRQGRHPYMSDTARRWRIIFPIPACGPPMTKRPTGATSARSTPIGRPILISPTSFRSRPLRQGVAHLDRRIGHAAAKFVHDEDGRRGMASPR